MRNCAAVLLTLFSNGLLASQTTTSPGINDYWITPVGTPGGISCKPLTLTTPLTMTMNESCLPGAAYAIVWSTCPCVACSAIPPLLPSLCPPGPTAACPGSNQFLEVGLLGSSCLTVTFAGTATTAGTAAIPVFVPTVGSPVTLSTQTIFLNSPCSGGSFNALVSQAWNVKFI